MANVGTLRADFELNAVKFLDGINKVREHTERSMKSMESFSKIATSSVGALAGALSLGGLVKYTQGIIDSAAKLKEFAERSGSSVEVLSGFTKAAKLSGVQMEDVVKGIQKLSISMVGAKEGTGNFRATFKTLGVDLFDSNKRLRDAGLVMYDVAKSLENFRQGASKTKVLRDIFGKTGADLYPFFKDLIEQGSLAVKVWHDQAEAADNFNKALISLKSKAEGAVRPLLLDMLPTLERSIPLLIDGSKAAIAYFAAFVAAPRVIGITVGAISSLTASALALSVSFNSVSISAFLASMTGIRAGATITTVAITTLSTAIKALSIAFIGFEVGKSLIENFEPFRRYLFKIIQEIQVFVEYTKFALSKENLHGNIETIKKTFSDFLSGATSIKIEKKDFVASVKKAKDEIVDSFFSKKEAVSIPVATKIDKNETDKSIASYEERLKLFREGIKKIRNQNQDDFFKGFGFNINKPSENKEKKGGGGDDLNVVSEEKMAKIMEKAKANADNIIKGIDAKIASINNNLALEEKMLGYVYEDSLISIKDYYNSKNELSNNSTQKVIELYNQEIAAIKNYQKAVASDSAKVKEADTRIIEITQKKTSALDALKIKSIESNRQQVKDTKDYYNQLTSLEADYQAFIGNSQVAAKLRIDQQNKELIAKLKANKDQRGIAILTELEKDQVLRSSKDMYSGLEVGIKDYYLEITNYSQLMQTAVTNAFRGMEDAIVKFVKTGKLDFKSLVDSMISDIIRLEIRQTITEPLLSSINANGGIIASIKKLMPFADGGIMTSSGALPLKKYSTGGVANSAQLAMFGEGSVPEAYVPVPSGKIPVELNGLGRSGVVVNVIDQRSASSQPVEISSSNDNGMQTIKVLIKNEISSQLNNGGLDKAMRANFGLTRPVVRR